MLSIADTLRKAADRIGELGENWTTEYWAVNDDGKEVKENSKEAVAWCAIGAVTATVFADKAPSQSEAEDAIYDVAEALADYLGLHYTDRTFEGNRAVDAVSFWNDNGNRGYLVYRSMMSAADSLDAKP